LHRGKPWRTNISRMGSLVQSPNDVYIVSSKHKSDYYNNVLLSTKYVTLRWGGLLLICVWNFSKQIRQDTSPTSATLSLCPDK
jgi:hypothetical protein